MKKMQTQLKVNTPQPGPKPAVFFNTRTRDLTLIKRTGFAFLALFFVVTTAAVLIARYYPESRIAFTVRALLMDPTVVDTPQGQALVKNGRSLVNRGVEAFDAAADQVHKLQGKHPDQETNLYLSGLVYLGENFYSTATPVLGIDYEEAECSPDEKAARIQGKVYCKAAIKADYKLAARICDIKWKGAVASKSEITSRILTSSHTLSTNESMWTRDEQIEDGIIWDTHRYLVYDPDDPERYRFIEPKQEKHTFFCVVSNSK